MTRPLPPGMARMAVGDCLAGCEFPEVEIGKAEASDLLPAGTRVLAPCPVCGTHPLDAFTDAIHTEETVERAFARYVQDESLLLFHWTPVARRKQIIRHGLRPAMRPTTHTATGWRAPYVCFADTPSWAWALSAGQPTAPPGDWDLWQCYADRLEDPYISPADWSNGIHEVRTGHRVPKRHLWHVGTRTRPAGERVIR